MWMQWSLLQFIHIRGSYDKWKNAFETAMILLELQYYRALKRYDTRIFLTFFYFGCSQYNRYTRIPSTRSGPRWPRLQHRGGYVFFRHVSLWACYRGHQAIWGPALPARARRGRVERSSTGSHHLFTFLCPLAGCSRSYCTLPWASP